MRICALIASIFLALSPAHATPQESEITKRQLDLGVALLTQQADGGVNRVVSPYSIHSALTLLRLGAKGEVAAQLDKKLFARESSAELLNVYQTMNVAITAPNENATSVLANSLWLAEGYDYLARYVADTSRVFSAEPRHVDYKRPENARQTINSWVSSKTNSLIPQILPQGAITAQTTCSLVNALYFKSPWADEFQKELTKDESFWLEPSTEIKVPTMRYSESVGYFEDAQFQGVHLPYRAYDFALVVLAPKKKLTAAQLTSRLSVNLFSRAMKEQKFSRVNLTIPRFKVTQSRDLIAALERYGLTRLSTGDYTGISAAGIGAVGSVIHEAVVMVDEAGTEAAAATAVVMAKSAFIRDEEKPKEIKVDRPFAFILMHRPTQAPLFIGVVGDPR